MTDSPPLSQSLDLRAGATLGRYELLLPIAKGGMAQVWAARLRGSRGFQKLVAVKTILSNAIDSTRLEEMFLEEAQLAAQIHHPNVVGTLELGEHEGVLYLVMEWVEGEPIGYVIAKAAEHGGVPLAIGVNLIGQACKGLQAAHDLRDDSGALLGVVHRDVSPQNLLVTFSGTAKLVDFGIAKATSKVSGLTEAGEIKGKFAYMAPEQVRGAAIDNRTDLFALGILLYTITTGRHPFRGEHPGETVQNICSDRGPVPPTALDANYSPALEAVVLKALAKDPSERFSSANAMLSALEAAVPEPFDASFELEVAAYLKKLFGSRASERRAAIRVAQEHADRQRVEATSSSNISLGTLRTIALDQADSSVSQRYPATPHSSPETYPSITFPPPARPFGKVAGVAAALLITGTVLFLQFGRSGSSASAAAPSPVPPEVATVPVALPPPPSALPAPSTASSSQVEAKEEEDLAARKRTRKGARPVTGATGAQSAVKEAAGTAGPPQPAAAATLPQSPKPAPSVDAWDRGAFGGRH